MKTPRLSVRLLLLTCLIAQTPAPLVAQDKSVRPGINDSFKKPEVGKFVERFEREGREVYDHRSEIVDQCEVRAGMVVADVGAGTGLFTRLFAQRVGEGGRVFAVDIAKEFVTHVEETCKKEGLNNVKGVVCDATSTGLEENSVDLVFICDVYHHFEFPYRTMRSVRRALRPGGKVVLIDYHREEGKSSKFILGHVRAGREVFQREVELAGFELVKEGDLLKDNYMLRFEPASRKTERGHTVDSTDDVKQLLANGSAALLDVRELREWNAGHLSDAILVPLSDIQAGSKDTSKLSEELSKKLPKDKVIYFHCRSGGRVLIAADLLKPFGFDIRPLKLGFESLTQEGFEVGE